MEQFIQQHWVTIVTCVALIGICIVAVRKMAQVVGNDAKNRRHANGPPVATSDAPGETPPPEATFGHFPIDETLVRYKCGHDGWKDFEANFYGMRVSPTKDLLERRLDCPDCMTRAMRTAVARCCACGHAILPGDGVVAYGVSETTPKEWITPLPDGRAIGCLRMACCATPALYVGKWNGKNVDFIYDGGRTAAEECFATGKPIINNDM